MPFNRWGNWFPPTTVHPLELHMPPPPGYPYERLVPPPTTLTPSELLVRYYGDRRHDFDWTDPDGVLRHQMEVFLNYPNNVGAPLGSPGLVGKWERPNGLAAVPVPVHGLDPIFNKPQLVIEFRDRDQKGPSVGAHVGSLCGGEADPGVLQGAEDIVLDGLGGLELELVLAWPGYRPERFRIRIGTNSGGPMTRFDLGEKLTKAYAIFFRKVERERLLPDRVGFYNIALHQGANQRQDSLGVQFMQLHLVRFRNVHGGHWIADVEIV